MWVSIVWLFVLLSIASANVHVIDNGVKTTAINPELPYDVIDEHKEEPVIGDDSTIGNGPHGPIPDTENVIVTRYGPVRGYYIDESKIWQYLDIPYASFDPEYPFQEPTEPESWEIIREIIEHRSRCPQIGSDDSYTGAPNCLTLSVFLPQGAKNTDVLFHIHDGGFIRGSGDPRIYGPDYLVPKGVILILPNYRLGPLGFLNLQNNIAPGNAALKDLTMALNWTRENIGEFGGNPSNIVVSGAGVGAALAQYLSLVPKSQDYVSKVITESGCVLCHWAIDRTPLETANKLLKMLNESETQTTSDNVFKNISLPEIITAAKDIIFRPSVEREGYLTTTPWNLLHEQKLNKSFMAGATDRPGIHKAMLYTEESISAINKDFSLLLPNDLAFEQVEEEKETGKKVKVQYFGNSTITLDHMNELSLCHTDCSFLSPGIRNARLLVEAGCTVYLYEFSYVINTGETDTNIVNGAAQNDSLNYVFKRHGRVPDQSAGEYEMIELMTNLWVSFIQTGVPKSGNIEWQEFKVTNVSQEVWLSIDSKTKMERGFHTDRLNLWTDIYKEHFIEHNMAVAVKPITFSVCLVMIGSVKLLSLTNDDLT